MLKKISFRTKISLITLIAANISVLLGAVFFNWDVRQLLFAYWLESAVVGFYTILKLLKSKQTIPIKVESIFHKKPQIKTSRSASILFFLVHYGGFMLGHLLFITVIPLDWHSLPPEPFSNIIPLIVSAWFYAIALMFSHGISYYENFIQQKEYKKPIEEIFTSPYKRIFVMHITIILGAILRFPLLILIFLKTAIDIFSHLKERKNFKTIS